MPFIRFRYVFIILFVLLTLSCRGTDTNYPTYIPKNNIDSSPYQNLDLQSFHTTLFQSLVNHDYETMQILMQDPFTIVGWQSGSAEWPAYAAAEQIQNSYLPPETQIVFVPNADLSVILNDFDLYSMGTENANIVSAVLSQGWSSSGKDDAILLISQKPDGSYSWFGIVYALGGFLHQDNGSDISSFDLSDIDSFRLGLVQVLTGNSDGYESLKRFMNDSFTIAEWQGESRQITSDDAIAELSDSLSPSSSHADYNFNANINTILNGQSPYALFPNSMSFIYSQRWGPDGVDDVLLVISMLPDGTYYWSSLLVAKEGFSSHLPSQ